MSHSGSSPPPISHPAHSSYLLDLCTTWIGKHNWNIDTPSNFTRISFIRILVDVLTNTNMPDVWTCRAVTKLAREVRKTEFVSFVHIALGLADTIGKTEGGVKHSRKRKWKTHKPVTATGIRDRLNKWVITMSNHLWTHIELVESAPLPPSAACSIEVQAIVAFLLQAQSFDLHLAGAQSATMESELADSIICLAVCCVASTSSLSDTTADVHHLVNLLWETIPISSTFDRLVALFLDGEEKRPFSKNWQAIVMQKLQTIATLLRSHSLLKLEASLWACVLRHLEQGSFSESNSRADVEVLKTQLINAVDDAEARCFGTPPVKPSPSELSQTRECFDADEDSRVGEWEWEEMVGCWIKRSPVVKKLKLGVQHPPVYPTRALRSTTLRRRKLSPILVSATPSTSSSTIFSKQSERATTSDLYTNESDAQDDDDDETHRISIVGTRQVTTRCVSNFTSILANAQINRIVLHPNRKSAPQLPSVDRDTLPGSHVPSLQADISPDEVFVPLLDDSFSMLPSDDSLDMFAYPRSSPVAHR
jgi:hypothetical protein